MTLCWCAVGMNEAAKQFRRVSGFFAPPALRKALDAEAARHRPAETVIPPIIIRTWPDQDHGRHLSSTELGTSSRTVACRTTCRKG